MNVFFSAVPDSLERLIFPHRQISTAEHTDQGHLNDCGRTLSVSASLFMMQCAVVCLGLPQDHQGHQQQVGSGSKPIAML